MAVNDFWRRKAWPDDGLGFVFLARAALRVGAAMFPGEWNGHEPSFVFVPPLPLSLSLAKPWQVEEAYYHVGEAIPAFGPRSDEIYARGRQAREKLREGQAPALHRWLSVKSAIKSAFVNGHLDMYCRAKAGGRPEGPKPSDWWFTEKADQRWTWCQIDPRNPFAVGIGGEAYWYIYVPADQLERLCEAMRPARSILDLTAQELESLNLHPISNAPAGPEIDRGNPSGVHTVKYEKVKPKIVDWLVARLTVLGQDQTMTKAELRDEAMIEFPVDGFSARQFERVIWPEATKNFPKWREGGANLKTKRRSGPKD